jgi:alkaline phosphatase
MKWLSLFLLLLLVHIVSAQLPLIHAHNDYQKPEPLANALRNKSFSIEADVYLINDTLRVAHDKNELAAAPSLHALYLQPLIDLFSRYHGRISSDSNYAPVLMIDIKENGKAVLDNLVKELTAHSFAFNRSVNPKAVQVVISGDRGELSLWTSYPSFILFDGRPTEIYDSATLQRVAFTSDSYINYSFAANDVDMRLQQLIQKVHGINKLLRLWAIPDNPESWDHLHQLGVDIINTDKVAECRQYFSSKSK